MTTAGEYATGPGTAFELDHTDPLGRFRSEFHIPLRQPARPGHPEEEIYLCGNSLGLQPKRAARYIEEELQAWQTLAVKGHISGRHPWLAYHELLTAQTAEIVGALPEEVVTMNSLTVNLHLMMATFYRPSGRRNRVLIERHAFPSDHYAVAAQIRLRGLDPDQVLMFASPRAGEECLLDEDIVATIDREGESIAMVLLPGVQYYTGQALDMASIARAARRRGCIVGFDLAHAAGNIITRLHDWDADFACWCSYKFLNGGPGAVAGCFVHQRHARDASLPRLAGWWGHDKQTRFLMGPEFHPIPTAEGWQVSNPPILSLTALRASLDVFSEAGGMAPLRAKSVLLTGYLEFLLRERLAPHIRIITPGEPDRRGCQLSLQVVSGAVAGREFFDRLESAGVTCDWREPNVIRVAPTPLYNSFHDVYRFVEIAAEILEPGSGR